MNTPLNTWKEKWTQQPTLMLITIIIWSIFIGLCIQAGTLLFTFVYSFFKPIVAQNLYEGLNLYPLLQQLVLWGNSNTHPFYSHFESTTVLYHDPDFPED